MVIKQSQRTMGSGATGGGVITNASGIPTKTFNQVWFSDPATYPIIGILGFAVVFAGSYIGYKFSFCKDVRVTNKTKGQVLRSW